MTERADLVQTEYRYAVITDIFFKRDNPSALDALGTTVLRDETTARTEAQRQFTLLQSLQDSYQVTIRPLPTVLKIGDTVTLQLDRFGLEAGRDVIITNIATRASRQRLNQTITEVLDITVWG